MCKKTTTILKRENHWHSIWLNYWKNDCLCRYCIDVCVFCSVSGAV